MKKIQSKMEVLECSQHYTLIFRRSSAGNSVVSGRRWLKLELIQASMHVLISARMKRFQSKMKALEWSQHLSHCTSMGIFSNGQGQLTPQSMVGSGRISKLIRDFMVILVTCKNKVGPIKNDGARVFTKLYINFSDAQGQITQESMVISGRNLNSSKLSCMSSLPARMRMIRSKMKSKSGHNIYPIISL